MSKLKETDLTNEIINDYERGVQSLQNKPMSKKDLITIVNSTFGCIARNLVQGNTVPVPRFGQFEVHHRNARKGHNPQTGESMHIDARDAVVFKPSSPLKRIVNANNNPKDK